MVVKVLAFVICKEEDLQHANDKKAPFSFGKEVYIYIKTKVMQPN